MSYADRDSSHGAPGVEMPVEGVTGAASEIKSLLSDLASEIEDSRRRQSHALLHIERKLHAMEASKSGHAGEYTSSAGLSDDTWDAQTAEALTNAYEHGSYVHGDDGKSWLQSRFVDISHHLARSISDLRPQSAVHALGERIELFHSRVHDALDDMARRSDVSGLKVIEGHIAELGAKLADVQGQLSRLDSMEADLRSVMDEVSGERLVRLSEHQDVLADVIDATAQRTAEEFHARLAEANAISNIDGGRFDELRTLIEKAVVEQRQAEASASNVVSDLKALVETSISEQRKGEQDAMAMLDTVQQALVQVLDRIEHLEEQQHGSASSAPAASKFTEIPIALAIDGSLAASEAAAPHKASSATAERLPAWDIPAPPAKQPEAVVEEAIADDDSDLLHDDDEAELSPVERLRRDFIADAQRAKLKAAASWAEGAEATKGSRPLVVDISEAASNSVASLRSRLFGVSPKLLAAALGIIVAINGGLLLMSRKTTPPAINIETLKDPTAHVPPASDRYDGSASRGENATPGSLERRATKQEGKLSDTVAESKDYIVSGEAEAALDMPSDEASAGMKAAPLGTTVDTPRVPVSEETLAALYQQQVLAGLSANLGDAAAARSSNENETETGSIEAAYTPPEAPLPAESSEDNARSSKLDLPPATVGPLSLRLAAAAGDASAEFEVAARLAEGKGTNQNFKEAVRWYQRSATQGFAQAQYRIGTMYERGLGVQQDLGRARVWYQRAAEQGNVKAMHNLAVLSAGGAGGGPDYAGATNWFIKAAEYGLPDSQYNLAVLYENGLGVPQDNKTAYKWYALAARGGDKDAIERRDTLKATLSPADLKAAEGLASSFTPKAANPLANDPRAAGEDWKKRANAEGNG